VKGAKSRIIMVNRE